MTQKRVCILTLGVGSGHLRASEAVQRALDDAGDAVEVKIIDVLEFVPRWFHWVYVDTYWLMLRHAPWLWRRLFERRQRKHHHATAPAWCLRLGGQKVLQQIKSYAPQLVMVTEVGAAEIAALGRRERWFHAPILAVQTDYQTEPPWAQPEIDAYCVGSEEARAQLIAWGVASHRVFTFGIPVDRAFSLRFDKRELKEALGLDARPVVLVMGGGMGPAPLDSMVSSLDACGVPLQVLAVAGHDHELRRRLESLRERVTLKLHPFGWTDNVPELMAVSDLLITKPGGLTTAEAQVAGLPMILTHPIPGPEKRHIPYLQQKGVALHAETLNDLPRITSRLLASPGELQQIHRCARESSRPDAARAVAQVALAMLEKIASVDSVATAAGAHRLSRSGGKIVGALSVPPPPQECES